ncbi:hypothetical protein NSK_008486 [Nannochloropsis salina CCMP1776]|uniref:Pre-mRNA-splicing factor ISY1 n=1 Tax=Nannochloropsis salina CCMP1776 TaxID=1027361 RepID=A0A4D9CTZ2_9STRA|nr:hypothetical protein NSK_008486 [Nannochloropsis salina CCMP1776]|eukprot:TFJ80179.1 hypothetical protein NSK_008486 [Nannochloropsis salina CCMP1776]
MARNEEKAQAMLNKWLTMKKDLATGDKERRPFLSSDCHVLPEAERWRRQIIKEVTKKVSEVQNAGLGEHRLRDLNDQINKLLREKYHWQKRIKELVGGYIRVQAVVIVGAYIELQLDGQALQTPVLGVLSDRKKGMDGREGRREKGREGWQQRT